MILFFINRDSTFAVVTLQRLQQEQIEKLEWLFSGARLTDKKSIEGRFIGPYPDIPSTWSTNAVDVVEGIGIEGIVRIEKFKNWSEGVVYNHMLSHKYNGLSQEMFQVRSSPKPVVEVENIARYNEQEGLAMSGDEVEYLNGVAKDMGRKLTDSEVFGFSQVNSEHCRHKIFNGRFVIDGKEMPSSLFNLIKKTTRTNQNRVLSAYKDNCAFLDGARAEQFAPAGRGTLDFFEITDFDSVITVKAETHNFPTTVEPINGAATGVGGEIRDRMAGGKGAFPIAGTAVYMTAYPRLDRSRVWESGMKEREWLYNTPEQILRSATNGAADYGNHFGQPLITGSTLTFEHEEQGVKYGYDKVIMQAGGVGTGRKEDSIKQRPEIGDRIVVMGGDNYRIGIGGGASSSVDTSEESDSGVRRTAVQRSNPEMQKRVYSVIRALSESGNNPIVSIHDHGAGGHLNCLSELVEDVGGRIDIEKLPIGEPTMSALEIIGNESQERMGMVVAQRNIDYVREIADRERAPMYVVGEVTGDKQFTFVDGRTGEKAMDWGLDHMFGKTPQTVMDDVSVDRKYAEIEYDQAKIVEYIEQVLQLEAVACKDWAVSKADRSVGGRVAMQQTAGEIQLPLNNVGVVTFDYQGKGGIATALGHAPIAGMIDSEIGSELSIAESLTNIVFAPLTYGLRGVSLSANWMWPCRNKGEDDRLYRAVEAASNFAIGLGINIPTGKDSLSMTQKYANEDTVLSPGTVIISSAGEVSDVQGCVSPVLKSRVSQLVYVDFSGGGFELGGSSFGQMLGRIGQKTPTIESPEQFAKSFEAVQELIKGGKVLAGHDVSSGGLITTLLEMTFGDNRSGMSVNLDPLGEKDMVKVLFSERPSIVLQVEDGNAIVGELKSAGVKSYNIGDVVQNRRFVINNNCVEFELPLNKTRDVWFRTSYLLDLNTSSAEKAKERYDNYKNMPLEYKFPEGFTGKYSQYGIEPSRRERSGIRVAIIREKGSHGDREMAWMLHLAGLDVKDVHMTDLVSGRETLEDVNLIAFVGGATNSDVYGSARGWAASFIYNEKAKKALDNFYARTDTLSIGICNGCQLMMNLGLITPTHEQRVEMQANDSGKFECGFVGLDVKESPSIMLRSLEGSRLGVWYAHGEGHYSLPYDESRYNIPLKYSYNQYPANPNGSDYNAAGIVSDCGRHLAMMPHVERTTSPWNWAHYPEERAGDQTSPWIEMFVNAREWIKEIKK